MAKMTDDELLALVEKEEANCISHYASVLSEQRRKAMDYYSHTTLARPHLERLAALQPSTLACMHGSAWRGDGARLLRDLAAVLTA